MTVFNSNVNCFRRAQFSLGLPFKLKLYIIKFTTTNTLNLPKNFYPIQADPKNGMSSNTCPVQNSFQVTILRISRCDRPQNVHKNMFSPSKRGQCTLTGGAKKWVSGSPPALLFRVGPHTGDSCIGNGSMSILS